MTKEQRALQAIASLSNGRLTYELQDKLFRLIVRLLEEQEKLTIRACCEAVENCEPTETKGRIRLYEAMGAVLSVTT